MGELNFNETSLKKKSDQVCTKYKLIIVKKLGWRVYKNVLPRATKGGRGRGRSSHEDVVSVAALQELDVTAALGQNP